MNEDRDILNIKIQEARKKLPETTREAIDAVNWKPSLLGMRQTKGYTFEQLGDLEIETDLVLAGLLSPEQYPKELEKRMGITKDKVKELLHEMNTLVFSRVREEMIKITERSKKPTAKMEVQEKLPSPNTPVSGNTISDTEMPEHEQNVLKEAGIKILPSNMLGGVPVVITTKKETPKTSPGAPDKSKEAPPIIEKLIPVTKDMAKPPTATIPIHTQKLANSFQIPIVETNHSQEKSPREEKDSQKIDPYREIPE